MSPRRNETAVELVRNNGRRTKDGYVMVSIHKDHPYYCMGWKNSIKRFQRAHILEHRLVMAESLGRPLKTSESVHHINGDRADNRIENLQLRNRWHGKGQAARCRECGSRNIEMVEAE